jgi:hypothetical protein
MRKEAGARQRHDGRWRLIAAAALALTVCRPALEGAEPWFEVGVLYAPGTARAARGRSRPSDAWVRAAGTALLSPVGGGARPACGRRGEHP